MTYRLIQGDNRQILKQFPDNHFDSIVTDPPYGIDFLGKSWDANTGALDSYQECLRVLKPGGHILAFSAPRTYHHLAITLEQAGFEIRDQIMWIYSSGFPKSQDVGRTIQRGLGVKETLKSKGMNAYALVKDKKGREKWMNPGNITSEDYPEKKDIVKPTDPLAQQWAGWGTALKPAHEPIALARKPIKTSIAKNVEKYGTGALNIDATRIPYADENDIKTYLNNKAGPAERGTGIHGEKINMFEKNVGYKNIKKKITREEDLPEQGRFPSNVIGLIEEPYQKYFYCPKVSRRERHIGFKDPGPLFPGAEGGGREMLAQRDAMIIKNKSLTTDSLPVEQNNHPTVKPVALMEYLIKLVTPPNGLVLDPFNGSGSTGMAAVGLGMDYIGIDLDTNYIEISKKRIDAWHALQNPNLFKELFVDATL